MITLTTSREVIESILALAYLRGQLDSVAHNESQTSEQVATEIYDKFITGLFDE